MGSGVAGHAHVRSPAPSALVLTPRTRAASFDQRSSSSSAPSGSPSPVRSHTLEQLLAPRLREQVRAHLLCLLLYNLQIDYCTDTFTFVSFCLFLAARSVFHVYFVFWTSRTSQDVRTGLINIQTCQVLVLLCRCHPFTPCRENSKQQANWEKHVVLLRSFQVHSCLRTF